jgi:nitrite reductase (cytochrome c-552)
MATDLPPQPPAAEPPITRPPRRRLTVLLAVAVFAALLAIGIAALLVTIFHRREEARHPYLMFVEVDENTTDPAVWGTNWPRQYESYLRTTDAERTRYGGSDAIPRQKLDSDPWLRTMWAGYAFSLDYRESRGHAYTLQDQDHTERVLQRPQPGACLHCHASIIPAYRAVGDGDVFEGFRRINAMPWNEARNMTGAAGQPLVEHPLSCVDCHSPRTMELRITRPAFITGIQELKRHQGVEGYDVNRDATRQEMRAYVCAQCHVEYYFRPGDFQLTYPWSQGILVEEIEAYYDGLDYADWTHGITGARALKAQHPEFELWSQGIHARAGVSCADCHMPYRREGAMKISDHHVRSPLLNIPRACQPCHNVPESELEARVHTIQDRTHALIDRSSAALVGMIEAIATAAQRGATDEQLARARELQRRAQWRIDFVYSEGSHGFHASQETARILAEAIDYARQGEAAAFAAYTPAIDRGAIPAGEVGGVTPTEEAPPGRSEARPSTP